MLWNENAADLSVNKGFPGKAVKILRQSRNVLLNSEDREGFDRGKRSVKCCEWCTFGI